MMLAHVGQELMDQSRYFHPWCVDPRNQLRDDLEPGVDVDGPQTFIQGFVHVVIVPIIKPESQQSQSVLKVETLGQRDSGQSPGGRALRTRKCGWDSIPQSCAC